ncbi:MAG: sialidase family protein [Verrucomicrobia bacterium]|nr:sialidase family protein [Verrucomicrobiota bacterium]
MARRGEAGPRHREALGANRTHSLFSDDHGKTWQLGADAADHTSEPQVIEWDSHMLLMNARTISGYGEHRTFVISKDRGETWKPAEGIAPLVANNCQGCAYRCFLSGSNGEFDWIFTHPISAARTGVHAWISEDAGKS